LFASGAGRSCELRIFTPSGLETQAAAVIDRAAILKLFGCLGLLALAASRYHRVVLMLEPDHVAAEHVQAAAVKVIWMFRSATAARSRIFTPLIGRAALGG
jgi:hypothetical protein